MANEFFVNRVSGGFLSVGRKTPYGDKAVVVLSPQEAEKLLKVLQKTFS